MKVNETESNIFFKILKDQIDVAVLAFKHLYVITYVFNVPAHINKHHFKTDNILIQS